MMNTKIMLVTQGLDSLSKILEYNVRIKEVKLKQVEIKEKSKSMNNALKAMKEIELKELEEQSNRLKEVLKVTSKEIKNNHIEKKDIIKSINQLTKGAMDSSKSMEEKRILLEFLEIQSNNLKVMGEQGLSTLQQLADTTQKAIIASYQKRAKFTIPSTLDYISE